MGAGTPEQKIRVLKDFTQENVEDRDLILKMFKYEDSLLLGDIGQKIYKSYKGSQVTHMEAEKDIARLVLKHFGFSDKKSSLDVYRKNIGKTYYSDSKTYDEEIAYAVVYRRQNKLLYYTTPEIKINQIAPDISSLYTLDETKFSLHNYIDKSKCEKLLVCAFSAS